MNLSDITTKPWILALFKRDDGERFLLGDGYYDFKDSLQHFQPNTMANDIVELQGTDGQLLAGQVRRGASQSFDGIIGDGTTTKKVVEERRRDFLMFFRKKHFYTVIYIFCDGTAIKRERGYIVDAPSVPEIRQLAPSYHVALNFENVNYYEYREDSDGNEIYSNTRNVVISTLMTGGLIWDNLGAVSEALQWANEQTAQGAYITINDGLMHAPMSLTQLNGNATQSGTPTPDSPQPISTVTGENTVKVTGKNLAEIPNSTLEAFDVLWTAQNGTITIKGTTTRTSYAQAIETKPSISGSANYPAYVPISEANSIQLPAGTYTISADVTNAGNIPDNKTGLFVGAGQIGARPTTTIPYPYLTQGTSSASLTVAEGERVIISAFYEGDSTHKDIDTTISNIQLELGSQASDYQAYQAQDCAINLGKNLLPSVNITRTRNDVTFTHNDDGTITLSGTATADTAYPINNNSTGNARNVSLQAGSYIVSGGSDVDSNVFMQAYYGVVGGADKYTQGTFTLDATGTMGAYIYVKNGTNTTGKTIYPMVEAGSKATSYAPYFTPIELAKIGTYQDRIYKDDDEWYIEKQVGKITYDGSEAGWFITGNVFRNPTAVTGGGSITATAGGMSNYYTYWTNTGSISTNLPDGQFGFTSADWLINIRNSSCADVPAFKTWLGTHPTTVYYALATPTTTEITDETLLSQLNFIASLYEGVNNISLVGTGAQGTMEINYYAELQPGGGFEWEDGGTGGATLINVEGVDAASPIWTIKGSATNPTLTNITTGQTITWTGTVPSGQTLIIDMDKQTATMEGANVFEFISGDWLDLAPGINRVTYSVLGTDQPSTLSWNNIVG